MSKFEIMNAYKELIRVVCDGDTNRSMLKAVTLRDMEVLDAELSKANA